MDLLWTDVDVWVCEAWGLCLKACISSSQLRSDRRCTSSSSLSNNIFTQFVLHPQHWTIYLDCLSNNNTTLQHGWKLEHSIDLWLARLGLQCLPIVRTLIAFGIPDPDNRAENQRSLPSDHHSSTTMAKKSVASTQVAGSSSSPGSHPASSRAMQR